MPSCPGEMCPSQATFSLHSRAFVRYDRRRAATSTVDPGSAGVWECTPGPSHWTLETNEVIHVVSGRMTVTPDGGEATVIGAGDAAVFPRRSPLPRRRRA